jgi:plasmid stabilization system protein ParE
VSARVVYLAPGAEDDIRGAFSWYRDRNVLAANAFRAEVFAAIEHIAVASFHPAADEEGNRRRVLRRYPYSVVYELAGYTATVLAVAHHRRRPGYWR